jgi:hypothetical protein
VLVLGFDEYYNQCNFRHLAMLPGNLKLVIHSDSLSTMTTKYADCSRSRIFQVGNLPGKEQTSGLSKS